MTLASEALWFGRFRPIRKLGEGGMGAVFEVYDEERTQRCALKAIHRMTAGALYRFKREFRALTDLHHPNLVRFGELLNAGDTWAFTMELLDGQDFLEHVSPERARERRRQEQLLQFGSGTMSVPPRAVDRAYAFDEAKLRSCLAQLATGLSALHAAGLLHRDVKPSNVVVEHGGRAVLLDFGLVTHADERQSTAGGLVGTAAYMAPEQAASTRIGPAADWYSVGVMTYEALTGHLPFEGTQLQLVMAKQEVEPDRPSSKRAGIPEDLDELCFQLLRRDPAKRPTPDQILARLKLSRIDISSLGPVRITQASPFVGRQRELSRLYDAFAAVRRGAARKVLVRGESGIGKSTLMRHVTDELLASHPGSIVLTGRCYEREYVPFKAFDGVADGLVRLLAHLPDDELVALLPEKAGLLGQLFPVLRGIEAIARADGLLTQANDPHEQRRRLFSCFRELLVRLSRRWPLVVAVDDLQWTDIDSMSLLGELMAEPDAPTMLFVATRRLVVDDESALERAVTAALGDDVDIIDLSALGESETRELIERLHPPFASKDELFGQIRRESRGHPMFVHELVRHASTEGAASTSLALDEVLWRRATGLDVNARAVLELLCVAGAPVARAVISLGCQLSGGQTEVAMAQLRAGSLARARLVRETEGIEPYHDRVRETVVAHLGDEQRARWHERIALALERSGSNDAQALVRHLEAAGQGERAAVYAERAAARSAEAHAFEQAALLYETVLRLGRRTPEQKRALTTCRAECLVSAGRGVDGAHAFLEASEGAHPAARLSLRRKAAEHFLVSGHIEEGLRVMRELLSDLGEALPETPRAALLRLLWWRARISLRGLRWHKRHATEVAEIALMRLDVYKALSHGLALVDNIRGADFQSRGLLLALRVGEPLRVSRAMTTEAGFLVTQGPRYAPRARELLARARAIADEVGEPTQIAYCISMDGILSCFAGDFRVAADVIASAEAHFVELHGCSWELSSSRVFRLLALRFLGDMSDLRRLHDEYVRDAVRRGDRYTETSFRRFCNVAFLALDDVQGAMRSLARAAWPENTGDFHAQHWFDLEARGELALYEDCVDARLNELASTFAALEKSMLLRVQVIRCLALCLEGRLYLRRLRDLEGKARSDALAKVRRNQRMLAREPQAFAKAWALVLDAGVSALEGRRDECVAQLERALAESRKAETGAWSCAIARCIASFEGDAESLEAAETELVARGIANPARFSAMLVPILPLVDAK